MILDSLFRASGGERTIRTSADLAKALERNQSRSGVDVTVDRAMLYATVYACVKVLAESVGQMPLHLYREVGREKKKATDHPLFDVLHVAPNAFQTSQEWKEWAVACLAQWGNAYCHINRVRGTVRELGPIHPRNVTPRLNKSGGEVRYEVQMDGGAETLPSSEILHLKLLPLDGVLGASPIRYAREAIGLGIGAETFGASLFANGAQPGGVLQHPKTLTKGVVDRLRDSWEERHQGAESAHKIAVLEEGMTFQAIGFPAKDAQFLETRKYQRSEVAGLFRVPPHLIGDLERATFTNIEHQGLDFVVHGLVPYLIRFEQRITLQLLTKEERREFSPKFNVAGLLRGDMAARSAFYTAMINAGVMSPNEVREKEDLNPREGGDLFLTPLNMAPSGGEPAPE